MKRVTFIFKDHATVATNPHEVDLCISELPYSELMMIEITDDNDRNHYFKVTRLMN